MTIAKLAVILLAATALASSAVAEQRRGRAMTCRGVLTATSLESGDTYRLGHCRIQVDACAGVIEAIARACKVGDRCTVRARVHDGEITYVYSVARGSASQPSSSGSLILRLCSRSGGRCRYAVVGGGRSAGPPPSCAGRKEWFGYLLSQYCV